MLLTSLPNPSTHWGCGIDDWGFGRAKSAQIPKNVFSPPPKGGGAGVGVFKVRHGVVFYLTGNAVVDLTSLNTRLVWMRATPGTGVRRSSTKRSRSLRLWMTTFKR